MAGNNQGINPCVNGCSASSFHSGHTRLLDVWMSHGDRVVEMPPGFKLMASTDAAPVAGMADDERGYYGVQFHPEVTHTRQGERILQFYCRYLRL